MYFRLCDRLYLVSAVRLDWVFTHDTISLTRNMFMHSHALHIVFLLSYALSLVVFSILILSLSLSHLVFLSWHLRNLFLLKTRYVVVPLPLLLHLVILFGFVMRRHEMTSLRTFLTGLFIWNIRSFCLTFQTLLYPMHLAFRDGLLYVRNSRGSWRVHTGVLL